MKTDAVPEQPIRKTAVIHEGGEQPRQSSITSTP
jgi:hypothetical protein